MKYAAIDIGTNTVLLLIVDVRKGLEDVLDISTITRLGEGLKEKGYLSQEAMTRTFSALDAYKRLIDKNKVLDVYCVGTSALREAKNSGVFLKLVKEKLGFAIQIISEREEAYYTYLSVKNDCLIKADDFIIVDIGGGSTEVIKGDKKKFIDFFSIPIGSVKLTEMFVKHDPPEEEEIKSLVDFIQKNLPIPFDGKNRQVIGTAGTITNLASIILGMESYDKGKIHGFRISYKDVENVISKLKCMATAERRRMKGMEKGREDIILQGIILMREIMSYFCTKELTVSANGVRYGVIFERPGMKF